MIYEAISKVNIRREPRVVEYFENSKPVSNKVGQLDVGTQREVYSVVTNPDNTTWGRISEADSAGISEWVCIRGLNRTYMKLADSNVGTETRLNNLEQWARTKGYKG